MNKLDLIQKVTFGESIAELEVQKLKDYFLKTEFWNLIRNGTNDIVYGAKGVGKSEVVDHTAIGKRAVLKVPVTTIGTRDDLVALLMETLTGKKSNIKIVKLLIIEVENIQKI